MEKKYIDIVKKFKYVDKCGIMFTEINNDYFILVNDNPYAESLYRIIYKKKHSYHYFPFMLIGSKTLVYRNIEELRVDVSEIFIDTVSPNVLKELTRYINEKDKDNRIVG